MTRRLTAVRVGNFKAFADTQRVPIKPITLIFGPNSAGKSSFIHSLALAHEAQFGREKRSLAPFDLHHTAVGGSAIDLGGFRQYVHRGQLNKRVEWGAELQVSQLTGRREQQLSQLLAPIRTVALNISIGMELDDQDRPRPGAVPRVEAIEVTGDNAELLRMSRRRADGHGSSLRLDRLHSAHPVFRQLLKVIVESFTTSQTVRPEDFDSANEAIDELLPELLIRVEQFFPASVELPKVDRAESPGQRSLLPVSKGNRREDIAQAVRLFLPHTLNELITGVTGAVAEELKQLQYLGPLRSFPPRHLAFSEYEDTNWYAGGGYAWDKVRRDDAVRDLVNGWLGSTRLQTPYKLIVRPMVALDQMQVPLEEGLEEVQAKGLDIVPDYDGQSPSPVGGAPVIIDTEAEAQRLVRAIENSAAERIRELVLLDQRTNTVVTHRDVGIGISQVLPVLVMAFGSEGKLLAMEQPEIHLHPALQAELGDVFIEGALGDRNNTFILETHSEHLIHRIMRRIREGKVRSTDVAVIFAEPLRKGSRFLELRLDKEGDFIDEWPGGFFEESYHEKFASR
jgi:hypothetical protein